MSNSKAKQGVRAQSDVSSSDDDSVVWLRSQPPVKTQPKPLISIILVSYFTGPPLFNCLDSVLSQDFPFELILIDNGNPKNVSKNLEALTERHHNVKLRSGHGNVGFAKACNIGAKAASGHHLMLLNPDTELEPGSLDKLYRQTLNLERPWMIGPRILNDDGTEQRGGRRATLTPWTAFVEATKLYKWMPKHPIFERFNKNETACPPDNIITPVISGACMLLPKEDFWAIGGMDEAFFLHFEDIDFCHRFNVNDGDIYFTPHVSIKHQLGTSEANTYKIEWYKFKGVCRYFLKNFQGYYPTPFIYLVNVGAFAFFLYRVTSMLFHSHRKD